MKRDEEINMESENKKDTNLTPMSEIENIVKNNPLEVTFNGEKQLDTIKQEKDKATDLVDEAFSQAIVHKVKSSEKVQDELLSSAEKVIDNKLNVIKTKADTEDKESFFTNNKDACECWGYAEKTTSKRFVKLMAVIHDIFTLVWVIIGTFTFAPITFVAKKIQVIVKKSWVAVLLAVIIYLAIILTPTLTAILASK